VAPESIARGMKAGNGNETFRSPIIRMAANNFTGNPGTGFSRGVT